MNQDSPKVQQEDETEEEYLKKWTPKLRQNSKFPYETESDRDWVDDRFQSMDTGPFFSSSIHIPGRPIVPKGIAIKVGDRDDNAAILYDMEKMNLVAAWTDGFLEIPPARFGILNFPKIAGEPLLRNADGPTWKVIRSDSKAEAITPEFVGIHVVDQQVTLEYTIGTARVLESPVFVQTKEHAVYVQRFQIERSPGLELELAEFTDDANQGDIYLFEGDIISQPGPSATKILIEANDDPQVVRITYWIDTNPDDITVDDVADVFALTHLEFEPTTPQGRRFSDLRPMKGVLSEINAAYVVDTIPLPFDNRYNALLYCGGVDFDSAGRAYVCTIHGDVWQVDGIDEELDEVVWRRFATGLYQPLGLKIVSDQVYVLGRDRITRLHDKNDDGEADFYENFNDDLLVTGQPHGYAMGLETDPDGNFYFIKSGGTPPHGGTMVKVLAEGASMEVVSTGYRHANGMGIGPDGFITSADNEGNWIPATRIDHVQQGGFYGHMPTHRREVEPEIYDPPLCWVPRSLDNSAGGQVWAHEDWGPLSGQMLHLSYGRCTINPVLRQKIGDQWQAAAYKLPLETFQSGVHRGRFNPRDGHLYVVGTDGWQTAAVADGCFQRVRYTGKAIALPIAFEVYKDRIEIEFSESLDESIANDMKNYFVQQWNYRWTSEYGSEHYSVSDPESVGQDVVEVSSVMVSDDGKRVSIIIDGLKPVMQMQVQANLKSASGEPLPVDIYNTIHGLAD